MKICLDCKHIERDFRNPEEGSLCTRHPVTRHPVTGSTQLGPFSPFAAGERMYGECGPDAKFFEERAR